MIASHLVRIFLLRSEEAVLSSRSCSSFPPLLPFELFLEIGAANLFPFPAACSLTVVFFLFPPRTLVSTLLWPLFFHGETVSLGVLLPAAPRFSTTCLLSFPATLDGIATG